MPSTASKENVGRLKSFKNVGRDNDVCPQLVTDIVCRYSLLSIPEHRKCEEEGMT